jgi:peptide/nickel transport system substrate-binding protein
VGIANAPATLDPRFATDAASTRVNRLLYERLVEFDERFEPRPGIARWRRLSPTHYRFTLGPTGGRFPSGEAVTAADVKATYDSILDPATGSPHRSSLEIIEAIDAVDAETVDFLLRRPDTLFPGVLVVGILPAGPLAGGHPFHRQPLGSGVFEIVDWPDENRLRLSRRRDGQRIEFVRVADATVRALKLARGEVDLVQGDLPTELVGWLGSRPDVRVVRRQGTNFAYLGFNLADPVTGDARIRRAVAHAIDRDAIIGHVFGGAARPANGILVPDHWAGSPALAPIPFDPGRARDLVRAAGYGPRHRPRLVYKTSSDPFRIRIATIIQSQLERVGIDVALRTYDWGTFYGDVKAGRFQVYSLAWIGIKMPDIFRFTMHSSAVPPAGANRGRFASDLADQLIEQAEEAVDLPDKVALYRRLQAHLHDRLPYVPLWYEDQVVALGSRVVGYELGVEGSYDGLATATLTWP